MTERIIIAGAGGQGVMLLGKILATAAMAENKFTTCLPAYGAEVRGGTAYCMVVVSDEEIGWPYIDLADTLIIMNAPSLQKFKARVKPKGLVLVNSSLVGETGTKKAIRFPFTGIAAQLGNIKVANMVALGSYLKQKEIIAPKTILRVIQESAPPDKKDLIAVNQEALKKGMRLEA